MKLGSPSKSKTPFFKRGKLELFATAVKGRITQFEIHNGKITTIKVRKLDFLAAWKQLEKHLKKIK